MNSTYKTVFYRINLYPTETDHKMLGIAFEWIRSSILIHNSLIERLQIEKNKRILK